MIARVQKVSVVGNTQIFHKLYDFINDIVHGHECPPAVLEGIGDITCTILRDHWLRRNVAMVICAALRRAVPGLWSRLSLRPLWCPVVCIPTCWCEGLMGSLRCNVSKER